MPKGNFEQFEPGSEEFFAEKLIASARDYVVPTDQLRGKVLDAVNEVHMEQEGTRWIGRAILVTSFAFWIGTLMTPFVSAIQAKQDDRRNFVDIRTQELFETESMEIQSATSQAYSEWRSSLKQKFESE